MNELIDMGNVRTHLRSLMLVLGNAIADALRLSVPIARTRLEWWPRKTDKEVWSLRIQLSFEMRKKADNRTWVDAFARPTTVSLPGFFFPRDKVATDILLAHLVVMLQMEDSKRVAFDMYLSRHKPKELVGGRRHKVPSLASLGALRAAPRVAPSSAEFAALQVAPLPDGATFSNTPIRPRDHVFKGPNPLLISLSFPRPRCLHLCHPRHPRPQAAPPTRQQRLRSDQPGGVTVRKEQVRSDPPVAVAGRHLLANL